ncbi:CLCC1 [Branchiostoma lanceolatum]|uniref:Chloride channel CLIC-like protein 1 n=1 Tax=Branchiostoma lanceolatum TaxID=7740 RepID=A0A8K0EMA7_BRALA|nr:CLCC1 [Branchiostoma lanceolatum]
MYDIALLMEKMPRFIPLVAVLAAVLCRGLCRDAAPPGPDMGDWVDPGDMLNYDSDTGTMRNHPRPSEKQPPQGAPGACDAQLQEQQQLREQLQTCQVRLQAAEHTCQSDQRSSQQSRGGPEAPYVRRFVSGLLKQLGGVMEPTGDLHELESVDYDVQMTVTAANWLLLKKFSTKDGGRHQGSLQDTMQVLETLITGVSSPQTKVTRWQNRLEDYTGLEVHILMQACITVLLVLCLVSLEIWSRVSLLKQLLRLLLLGFIISVGWTWMHEYKRAHAKKQRELSKDMPRECRGADRTALHGILEWASSAFTLQEDKCANYHEALVVDAFWEVTPTKAFAVTLTKFFLEPMEHVGRSFSKFFEGVFHDLPVQLWPFAFLAMMLMSLLLMIMAAGYSINVPFIFSLQPRAVNTVTLPLETQTCMEDTRQQVLQIIDVLREQQRAVAADTTAAHVRAEQQRAAIADGTAHVRAEQQRAAITDGTAAHLRVEQVAPTISQADAPCQELSYNQAQNRINLSRGVSFTRVSSASSRPLAAGPHSKAALLQRSYSAPTQAQEAPVQEAVVQAPIQEAPVQEAHRDRAQKIPNKEESEDWECEEAEASTETLGPREGRGYAREGNISNISLD